MLGKFLTGGRLHLAVVALGFAARAAQGAEQASPFELRVQGSFPIQYVKTYTKTTEENTFNVPYLAAIGSVRLDPSLSTSVFVDGGHGQLGRFSDNDNVFATVGGNVVKRWGAFAVGASVEHVNYFIGTFERTSSDANDATAFARYTWAPNESLKIEPLVNTTVRFDDNLTAQRYSYGLRIDIEQRLVGSWWLIATPRIRYDDYVGNNAVRRDTIVSVVAGLKYVIDDRVSFTTLAGVQDRASNITSKSGDRFIVGASIDFNFNFMGSR